MKLTSWFNLVGWPETIRTEGGPQFRLEFDEFCKNFYIHHKLSSPYHPELNGLAEAAVKNAKSLLKKCKITGQNFQRSVSVFLNMPCSDGPLPASLSALLRLTYLLGHHCTRLALNSRTLFCSFTIGNKTKKM